MKTMVRDVEDKGVAEVMGLRLEGKRLKWKKIEKEMGGRLQWN